MTLPNDIRLGPQESAALVCLAEHSNQGWAPYMRTIADETGLTYHQTRRAVRSLARKGLAQLVRGLFDDDGRIAGSGYQCTKAGMKAARIVTQRGQS